MRVSVGSLIAIAIVAGVSVHTAQNQSHGRQTLATEDDFRRAMKELSNWGRWGSDDELGAANLITPGKRKQAALLAPNGPSFENSTCSGSKLRKNTTLKTRPKQNTIPIKPRRQERTPDDGSKAAFSGGIFLWRPVWP